VDKKGKRVRRAYLQSEVEAEDRHPGAQGQGKQGEEEGQEENPRHPGGEKGKAEGGGQKAEEERVHGQIEGDPRRPPERDRKKESFDDPAGPFLPLLLVDIKCNKLILSLLKLAIRVSVKNHFSILHLTSFFILLKFRQSRPCVLGHPLAS